jgi:hypothetical protein
LESTSILRSVSFKYESKFLGFDYVKFVSSCVCYQDCEHNSFELSLLDPLHPVVALAGEVPGLIPTAVTDNPIEPRVFIVSRSAEATEVVRAVCLVFCWCK